MNRYAWTNFGPLTIMDGRKHSTAKLRRALLKRGIVVTSWARNWAEFLGYIETPICAEDLCA